MAIQSRKLKLSKVGKVTRKISGGGKKKGPKGPKVKMTLGQLGELAAQEEEKTGSRNLETAKLEAIAAVNALEEARMVSEGAAAAAAVPEPAAAAAPAGTNSDEILALEAAAVAAITKVLEM